MTHTQTPWSVDKINTTEAHILGAPNGFCCDIIGTVNTGFETGENDALRLVECVNACAGLNPAAIPDVVDDLKWLLCGDIDVSGTALILGDDSDAIASKIRRIRDNLAALQVQS